MKSGQSPTGTSNINPELLLPPRVLSGEIKLAKYVLCPFGLASDTVGDITLDNKIVLIQPHPQNLLYLCPLTPNPQPTEPLAWYYADCIAYEHDIPVIVHPTRGDFNRFRYRYLHSGATQSQEITIVHNDSGKTTKHISRPWQPGEVPKSFYANQLCQILEEIRELRHGPLTYVLFRHADTSGRLDLPYLTEYGPVAQELHLYATALRQADTLGEFLCYYRVIESATASNGKVWIAGALHRLQTHNFGFIPIAHEEDHDPRNMLMIYRYRALRRLATLVKKHGTPSKIATHLYNVERCGIAHGKDIIRADISPSYFEMVRDTYLMKLLARLAIDEGVAALTKRTRQQRGRGMSV